MIKRLIKSFSACVDPRCEGRVSHSFVDILVIAVCAVIAGAESWTDIASYGNSKKEWLCGFLKLTQGIPSNDTFRRLFSIINPELFEKCFYQWVQGFCSPINREVVAIDGKTVRGSFDKATNRSPLHIVSAFATEQGISLGQLAVDEKSNEIKAIPQLLECLSLKNCIVTLDAMGCQRAIATKIIDAQADYILALKGNQASRHKAVMAYFAEHYQKPRHNIPADYDAFDSTHGRCIRRRAWVCPITNELAILRDWPNIQRVIIIETIRKVNHTKQVNSEFRYYLSSCADEPTVLINAVRKHWAIENSLHWVLDVTFREDDSRIRDQIATRTFALLRKIALNIVKLDGDNKNSLKARRKCAGWDNEYMEHLLFSCRKILV